MTKFKLNCSCIKLKNLIHTFCTSLSQCHFDRHNNYRLCHYQINSMFLKQYDYTNKVAHAYVPRDGDS